MWLGGVAESWCAGRIQQGAGCAVIEQRWCCLEQHLQAGAATDWGAFPTCKWASLLRYASTAGWHCSICAPACLRLLLRTTMPAGDSSTARKLIGSCGHGLFNATRWLIVNDQLGSAAVSCCRCTSSTAAMSSVPARLCRSALWSTRRSRCVGLLGWG